MLLTRNDTAEAVLRERKATCTFFLDCFSKGLQSIVAGALGSGIQSSMDMKATPIRSVSGFTEYVCSSPLLARPAGLGLCFPGRSPSTATCAQFRQEHFLSAGHRAA